MRGKTRLVMGMMAVGGTLVLVVLVMLAAVVVEGGRDFRLYDDER